MSQLTYYDSAEGRRPVISELRNIWDYRGLLRLLVVRDLTIRYKRSTLGVWWTLLNPLLTSLVMWMVFSQLFKFDVGVPYVVYLLSGILVSTFVIQAVNAAGSAIVNSHQVLSKVSVPPEIFSISAATAAATNFLISVIPLLIIQIIMGVGIPWTVVLIPVPAFALLALAAGVGLIVASAAVFFYDVLDLTNVFLQLVTYLIPTFYPLDIVPEQFRVFVTSNPLYAYLIIFRGFVYEGTFAPPSAFLTMTITSVAVLGLGVWVFSKSWEKLVVLL